METKVKAQPVKCDLMLAPVPKKQHRGLYRINMDEGQYFFMCAECMKYLAIKAFKER